MSVGGGEIIVEATARIYNSEGGGLSVVAGAVPLPGPGQRAQLDPRGRAGRIGPSTAALAPTKLICL